MAVGATSVTSAVLVPTWASTSIEADEDGFLLVGRWWLSQQHACRFQGLPRSVTRYQVIPHDDDHLGRHHFSETISLEGSVVEGTFRNSFFSRMFSAFSSRRRLVSKNSMSLYLAFRQ